MIKKDKCPVFFFILIFLSLFYFSNSFVAQASYSPQKDACEVKNLPQPITSGGYPRVSPDGRKITFTRDSLIDPDGDSEDADNIEYNVYVINSDGSNEYCLTCDKPQLSNTGWRGQSSWHPSGEYITFTAENASYVRKGVGVTAKPGIGRNQNIWVAKADGSQFWQITDYPDNWGAIEPYFSHDGKKLSWNEEFLMYKYPNGKYPGEYKWTIDNGDPYDDPAIGGHPGSYWGQYNWLYRIGEELCNWRIRYVDISFDTGVPVYDLSNSLVAEPPEGFTVIEANGFTPDDKGFIVSYADLSKSPDRTGLWPDPYVISLDGSVITAFFETIDKIEEDFAYSPDGKKIVFKAADAYPAGDNNDEIYLMDADSSNVKQLTFYNDDTKSQWYDENSGTTNESSWAADGTYIVYAHSQGNQLSPRMNSTIYRLDFEGNCGNNYKVESMRVFDEIDSVYGGRVDWVQTQDDGEWIVYDQPNQDGYDEVYKMRPDGTEKQCLTCDAQQLSHIHNGNPAWHPSGEWIVFQSVNQQWYDIILNLYGEVYRSYLDQQTCPGAGSLNEIWIMDKNGQNLHKLDSIVNAQQGVLHAHFSHDGTKLNWTRRENNVGTPWGGWSINVGDFIVSGSVPSLINKISYQPGDNANFYETHGFSHDDSKLIYCGNPDGQKDYGFDIYTMDLATQEIVNLTNTPKEWDEHAILTPDGKNIVWMSTIYNSQTALEELKPNADFWIMNIDGTSKRRLTGFNDPLSDQYIPAGVACADSTWSPDGKRLLGYVIMRDRTPRTGLNYIIEFDNTVPTGTVTVNPQVEYTRFEDVNLELLAQDNELEIISMQLSNDGISWQTEENYETSKLYSLLLGDGEKKVFAKFKNESGLWSDAAESNIVILDQTPPDLPSDVLADQYTCITDSLKLSWGYSQDNYGVSDYLYAVGTSQGVVDVVGWSSAGPNPYTEQSPLVISTPQLINGQDYYIYLKAVDYAGNESELVSSEKITVDITEPLFSVEPLYGLFGTPLEDNPYFTDSHGQSLILFEVVDQETSIDWENCYWRYRLKDSGAEYTNVAFDYFGNPSGCMKSSDGYIFWISPLPLSDQMVDGTYEIEFHIRNNAELELIKSYEIIVHRILPKLTGPAHGLYFEDIEGKTFSQSENIFWYVEEQGLPIKQKTQVEYKVDGGETQLIDIANDLKYFDIPVPGLHLLGLPVGDIELTVEYSDLAGNKVNEVKNFTIIE